jgi:hypothetical protein
VSEDKHLPTPKKWQWHGKYGTFRLSNAKLLGGRETKHFLQIPPDTPEWQVEEFICGEMYEGGWGLGAPPIVLSISGAGKPDSWSAESRRRILDGIHTVVQKAKPWIFEEAVDGNTTDLMSDVRALSRTQQTPFVGVSSWGFVTDGSGALTESSVQLLNTHHTHFIFFETGSNERGSEALKREGLERYICSVVHDSAKYLAMDDRVDNFRGTVADLGGRLSALGMNHARWGKADGTKKLAQLHEEIVKSETLVVLKPDMALRVVHNVQFRIVHAEGPPGKWGGNHTKMQKEYLVEEISVEGPKTRQRKGMLMSCKVPTCISTNEAGEHRVKELVENELITVWEGTDEAQSVYRHQIHPDFSSPIPETYHVEDSVSYPGLLCKYVTQTVTVRVAGLPKGPFWSQKGSGGSGRGRRTLYKWVYEDTHVDESRRAKKTDRPRVVMDLGGGAATVPIIFRAILSPVVIVKHKLGVCNELTEAHEKAIKNSPDQPTSNHRNTFSRQNTREVGADVVKEEGRGGSREAVDESEGSAPNEMPEPLMPLGRAQLQLIGTHGELLFFDPAGLSAQPESSRKTPLTLAMVIFRAMRTCYNRTPKLLTANDETKLMIEMSSFPCPQKAARRLSVGSILTKKHQSSSMPRVKQMTRSTIAAPMRASKTSRAFPSIELQRDKLRVRQASGLKKNTTLGSFNNSAIGRSSSGAAVSRPAPAAKAVAPVTKSAAAPPPVSAAAAVVAEEEYEEEEDDDDWMNDEDEEDE